MGTWSAGSFGNDDAQDWVGDFLDKPGLPLVIQALTTVADADADEYLEASECAAAIAAAEIMAALNNHPNSELDEELAAWISQQNEASDPQLAALAIRAIQRIRINSEMKDLWEETEDDTEFQASLQDLEARVKATVA